MDSPLVQQTSLYNGVSNRSRGWKTRKLQSVPQSRLANPSVMRWDGVSRSSEVWDSLRRDPELWFQDGDCDVHLHSEGQSRRGPAFRVPYSALLEANCQLLIDNFVSRAQYSVSEVNSWNNNSTASCPEGPARDRIRLFIPAPAELDKRRSYDYHLATRNLFAFIFRRPMVGECLGTTLVTLMTSLQQLRTSDADNVQDLMSYIEEEGYSNLGGQATYALAMLQLAETFQLRDLYIEAFAHCCGMGSQIILASEYHLLSSVTRKSLRRARLEMHSRLEKATTMLKAFLYDDLCEINIELYPGAQEHLQRFRVLLQEVYAAYIGYYPLSSIEPEATIFEVDVFRTMRNDFEALYKFLVDESYDYPQPSKMVTKSGICILQDIELFDMRHGYATLPHPLPLLPHIPQGKQSSWRLSWLNKPSKVNQSQRANTLLASYRAAHSHRPDLLENQLVCAYQKFEEDQISATEAYSVDGRKIRWILIYEIYQTLRQATEISAEIKSATAVTYHLCVSTAGLPPWEEKQPVRTLECNPAKRASQSPARLSSSGSETKSNHGYPALIDRARWNRGKLHLRTKLRTTNSKDNATGIPIQKSSTLRRSLSLFIKHEIAQPDPEAKSAPYREIVVRGYGNGVTIEPDDKELAVEATSTALANPLSSKPASLPASENSSSSETRDHSETITLDTCATSITSTPAEPSINKWDRERASIYKRCGLHDINGDSTSGSLHVGDYRYRSAKQTTTHFDENRSVPRRGRSMSIRGDSRKSLERASKSESTPNLNIRMPTPQIPTAWDYIQAVMEVQASHYDSHTGEEWDQFAHLGNVIQTRSETIAPMTSPTVRRASTMF
ncbi:hypothetical protein O1611_g8281 [Lasiodiplodia mahajangana]|uniref:Uncharacterized protein n=1 Tax=Lasiodiplodia mahajangana TaxID=1108764 RepID=A0ACC2JCX9_9PEZI|nr:hypothetical protein O1611_g8281 [Lasiodiplodia mahajangana]